MDLGRVLGALVNGAVQKPARRRSSTPFGGRGVEARAARALGSFAASALETWMRNRQAAPAETAAPRGRLPGRWGEASQPAPQPAPQPGPWGARAPEAPAPVDTGAPQAEVAEALLMIRAMIAAAKSDGAIDAAERAAIATQLDTAGLTAEERDFILADLDRPLTAEALAREATDPMLRARLYAAAVLGAGTGTPAERHWLDTLAHALHLDRAAAAAIEERLTA